MYNIIKELKNTSIIEFYDKNKNFINSIPFTDITFSFIGLNKIHKLQDFNEEIAYQNIEIYSKNFNNLIIFQDYGDDSSNCPLDYDYLNRSLILPDNNSNLGYYNGNFVHIIISHDYVQIYDLFQYELPDLTTLNQKRPYTFSIVTKDNNLYYYITLSTDKYFTKLYKLNKTLKEVLSIKNVNGVLEGDTNNVSLEVAKSNEKYITRDYLVYKNFSYNNGIWTNGFITLTDIGNKPPLFLKYNNEFIFKKEELNNLLTK